MHATCRVCVVSWQLQARAASTTTTTTTTSAATNTHHDHYHHCGNGTFIAPPVVGAEVILTLLFVKVEMQRRAERP